MYAVEEDAARLRNQLRNKCLEFKKKKKKKQQILFSAANLVWKT